MPSQYILPNEYIAYGLPTSTTVPQVTQASAIIDAYLRRPEGLVFGSDFLGQPAYMLGLNPAFSWASAGAIAPGNKVAVPLTMQVTAFDDMIGEVVILDRANPLLCEACVIGTMINGQITLASVANNHDANCTIELGMAIQEEIPLPRKRSIAKSSRPPVRLLSGMGRYGYGRRTDQIMGAYNEVNLLAAIQTFGGPPMWVPFTISQVGLSLVTRELWIPAGILLAYYTEIRIRYISGWSQSALPAAIKQATANIIGAISNNASFSGQMKSLAAGQIKMERFTASQIDNDTRALLDNYRILAVQ